MVEGFELMPTATKIKVVCLTGWNVGDYTGNFASLAEVIMRLSGSNQSQAGYTATADSEQTGGYEASNAVDGNTATFWHTEFSPGQPGFPHEIEVDFGGSVAFDEIRLINRPDSVNGSVGGYELYHWNGSNWVAGPAGNLNTGTPPTAGETFDVPWPDGGSAVPLNILTPAQVGFSPGR